MNLPVMETGDIWYFDDPVRNNPDDHDYLGPVLIVSRHDYSRNNKGDPTGVTYIAIDLINNREEEILMDGQNCLIWRKLA